MKKIAIIGAPGTGKSTVAVKVGEILKLPVIHLDCYYWKPGWQEKSLVEFKEIHDGLIGQQEWIIEGCSTKTILDRMAVADVVVYLIAPRSKLLWRMVKRLLAREQLAVPRDCRPRLNWKFFTYMWNWRRRYEQMIMDALRQQGHDKRVFVIKTPQDLERFLQACHKSS